MPQCCCAIGCSNNSMKLSTAQKNVSFFSFPLRNKLLLRKWLIKLRRANFHPSKHVKLCSDHFTEDDFEYQQFTHRRGLKPDAFPTKFSFLPCDKVRKKSANSSEKSKINRKNNLEATFHEELDSDDGANFRDLSKEESESLLEISMNERFYTPEQIENFADDSRTVHYSMADLEDEADGRIIIMKDKLASKIVLRALRKEMLEAEIKVAYSKKDYYEAKTSSFSKTNKDTNSMDPLSATDLETYTSLKYRLKEEELAAQIEEKVLQQQLLEAEIKAANSKKAYYEIKRQSLLL